MIVPSAALPGTHNLILFGVRVLNPFLRAPLTPEEVPTGHLSDGARPRPRLCRTSDGSALRTRRQSSGS